MKIYLSVSCLCAVVVLLAACDTGTVVSPELTEAEQVTQDALTQEERMILAEVGIVGKAGTTISKAPVFSVDDPGGQAVGVSVIARYNGGIYALLRSTLAPGTAVTLWWVIFNAPENCTDNVCGEDDLTNPDARVDITYADGRVILPPSSRRGWRDRYFFAERSVGEASGSIVPVVFGADALGLEDAQVGEVHLVVRTHGRVIAGMEKEMISTFAGGCEGFPPELGTSGTNTCANIQFAVHKGEGTQVDRVELQVFMPAADVAGIDDEGNVILCSEDNPCPLVPGTTFPPVQGSHSTLRRGADWISYTMHTTGLPAGTYTNWWVILNYPDECDNPDPTVGTQCSLPDVFLPDSSPSVFWATGGVVQDNGVGNFRAKLFVGDDLGLPGEQYLFGPGLVNPQGAEVFLIVKYHGPASADADVFHGQTHTLLGSCDEGVNGFLDGDIVQCFDPQIAFHVP